MNILCAGLNHQSAPLEIREKFAVGAHGIEKALCYAANRRTRRGCHSLDLQPR